MWKWVSTPLRVLLRQQPMEKPMESGSKNHLARSVGQNVNPHLEMVSKWFHLWKRGLSMLHHIPPNQPLQCWKLASFIYSLSNPNYSCIFSTSHIITEIKKCTTEKSDSFFFQLKSASSCLPYVHPFPQQANYISLVLPKYDFRVSINYSNL